jgi:glycosyltransferase involved in cell wall biosynthesis
MKNKINILFLIDHFHAAGGTETHLTYLVTGLDKKRFNCSVVAFDFEENHLSKKVKDAGIPFYHIPVGRFYNWNAVKQARVLSRLIKELKIDIVQTFHIKSDTYGVLVSRLYGVRRIISSKRDTGDLKTPLHYMLNRLIKPLINRYISVCDAVAEIASRREHVSRESLPTIYNRVDLSKYTMMSEESRSEKRKGLGIAESDFVIGTVSWLRPEKGHDVFLMALKELSLNIKNFKVIIVGGGVLLNKCKETARCYGLDDKILFTGSVENVVQYLSLFDVACLFSHK